MNIVTPIRVFLLTMLLFAATSYADSLSNNTITGFISSLHELSTLEDEFEALTDDLDNSDEFNENVEMPDFKHVLSGALAEMKDQSVYAKLNKVVKSHGFSNTDQWAQAGDRIFHAWMALEMESQNPEMNQEMKKALAQLDHNPDIPAAQKEQIKAMMGAVSSSMTQANSAPTADMDAVRPHIGALRAATEMD